MPTTSVIAAAIEKYSTIHPSLFYGGTRPPIYLHPVPPVDESGLQLYAPYVVIRDNATAIKVLDFEQTYLNTTDFRLEVYCVADGTTTGGLAAVVANVRAIRFNGQAVNARAGFDLGELIEFGLPKSSYQVIPAREQYLRAPGGLSKTGQPVYVCLLDYRVTAKEQAS
jgi:hypothetical protein